MSDQSQPSIVLLNQQSLALTLVPALILTQDLKALNSLNLLLIVSDGVRQYMNTLFSARALVISHERFLFDV